MGLVDDMGGGTGGWGLGGITGIGGWVGGGGVGEWNLNRRERWGWAARNSLAVGISCSRVNEELRLQARVPADYCWRTVVSSLSSSEGKKLDDGWFLGVLGGDSGCEVSRQLELFKEEMMAV